MRKWTAVAVVVAISIAYIGMAQVITHLIGETISWLLGG